MSDQSEPGRPDEARALEVERSVDREKIIEHTFLSELLREAWRTRGKTIEVLRPEVDAYDYDLVLDIEGVVRHVQLKTSRLDSKTGSQKVNLALSNKPGGCMLWIQYSGLSDPRGPSFRYLFYGGGPHERLQLDDLGTARHTRADSKGIKHDRPMIRVVPKGRFRALDGITGVLEELFPPRM